MAIKIDRYIILQAVGFIVYIGYSTKDNCVSIQKLMLSLDIWT